MASRFVTDLGDSTLPIFLLCIAVVGVLLTANAFAAQRRSGPLVILSFFAGWLVSELPLHTLAIQVLGTLFFASAGALDAWPGQLGLALTFVSWGGLLALGLVQWLSLCRPAAPAVSSQEDTSLLLGVEEEEH